VDDDIKKKVAPTGKINFAFPGPFYSQLTPVNNRFCQLNSADL
jgi:hypothetical protein